MTHGDLTIRPVTEEEVRELSTWRNDPPYDVYASKSELRGPFGAEDRPLDESVAHPPNLT